MLDTHLSRAGLLDRGRERDVLDQLVADVRAGQSRVLVLRGEAGIGKTALLEYLSAAAEGCRIARAAGVESEMELAFAGLHALCAPMLGRLGLLPVPQRDALNTAFGMSAGPPPDRFLVGLAVLSLLADAAEEQPLVCIVDDAQWLDRVSVQTLAFVARRLLAERVGLVFALRESGGEHGLEGLPELVIDGLAAADARRLLDAAIPGPLDPRVRDRILGEAGGNPLALLELPRGGKPLAGGFGLPVEMPLTSRIEQSFVRQLTPLPAQTRRLLLLAAAEPVGDVPLLWRAAERLGIGREAAGAAEAAALIEIGARVRFRHPLVRSAAYRAAPAPERREVHRALADATDGRLDPDRRAWHRARAADGPDEAVAGELERSADRAQARGGLSAAAAFLQRAAELTPDPASASSACSPRPRRSSTSPTRCPRPTSWPRPSSGRLTSSSARGWSGCARRSRSPAGAGATRRRCCSRRPGGSIPWTPRLPGRPTSRRSRRRCSPGGSAPARMSAGGRGGPHVEPGAGPGRGRPAPRRPCDAVHRGVRGSVAPLSRALRAFGEPDGGDEDRRWLWLACRLAQDLWDDELWHVLATRGVRVARETGALNLLPNALNYLAALNVHSGAFATAAALIDEVDSITQATGIPPLKYSAAMLAAARGDQAQAQALLEWGRRNATERGEGSAVGAAFWLTALLHNGHGHYGEALAAARQACEHEDVIFYGWALVELIEAGVRSGQPEEAAAALGRLSERTRASGTEWALGIEARCRALLSDDESLYQESVERLARSRAAVELARSRLLYGEWLRRENRRVDAREQLRAAHEMFSRMGAAAFAERARRELSATGETVRKRTVETLDELTTQEAQVARLAAQGRTNPEIAAQLFISPRTVEYHLHKVFPKLGISSRKELRRALPGAEHAAVPA